MTDFTFDPIAQDVSEPYSSSSGGGGGEAADSAGLAAAGGANPYVMGAGLALKVISEKKKQIQQAKERALSGHQNALNNAMNWYSKMRFV